MAVLQAQAQHPVEHQGEETDQRMGANPIASAVEHWGDLDLGLEYPKAAFDVGERLVAFDDLCRAV